MFTCSRSQCVTSVFVHAQAQYILIHQALVEYNQFGETEVLLSELHSTLSTLRQSNSDTDLTLMEEEFDVGNSLYLKTIFY